MQADGNDPLVRGHGKGYHYRSCERLALIEGRTSHRREGEGRGEADRGGGGKGRGESCLLMSSVFTIKNGVGSSRGLEAKGGLRTEEKVGVRTLMPTH